MLLFRCVVFALVITVQSLRSLPRTTEPLHTLFEILRGSSFDRVPTSEYDRAHKSKTAAAAFALAWGSLLLSPVSSMASAATIESATTLGSFKLPYMHENLQWQQFLGSTATVIFNMKIDDPQTVSQMPSLAELYKKYSDKGLRVLAFPTEQGNEGLCLR